MRRLAKKEQLAGNTVSYVAEDDCFDVWSVPKKFMGNAIERLAAIEDILGDEYDLDRLSAIVNQRMTMREEVAERWKLTCNIPLDRLREMVQADKDKRNGGWVYREDDNIQCSICGHDAYTEGDYRQVKTNYCPNCGARMDKEDDHDKHPSDPL